MIHLKKISLNQLCILVILTQVGVGVLSIPYSYLEYSGYDSWMSILIGGVLSQAFILIMYLLGKRYPDRTLPQYIFSVVGKPLGSILNFLIAIYYALSSLLVVISYSDVINRWVLFKTPWFVILGFSLTIAAYIASSTLRSMATVTQFIMFLFMIGFVIIFISGMGKGDWRNFLPVGTHGLGPILKGVLLSFWLYSGYDILLYLFPFVEYRKKKEILMTMSLANGITTFFYVLISVIVIYNFNENQLKYIPEPMVYILRKFKWPVVQSLDILFMTIWLAVTSVTAYVYLFLSARYMALVRRKENQKHLLLVCMIAILCFIAGLWFSDRQLLSRFSTYHNTSSFIMVSIVPTILLLISWVRGKAVKG
jgi:spore germination protein (amino acid permease)